MNGVVAAAWAGFTLQSAPSIKRSFAKTCIFLLRPPSNKGSVTAAMQCSSGKKNVDFGLIDKKQLGVENVTVHQSADRMIIFKADKDLGGNLLFWSVTYDILNTTLLEPSQEIKLITQEHVNVKRIKTGPGP